MSMKGKIKLTDKILFTTVILLSLLYILSFTKSCSSTDKRHIIKSAVVNKKYADKIDGFQLIKGNDVLLLSREDNNWYVKSTKNSNISLPADNKRIEKFIKDLTSIQNMYKLSDNPHETNSFGLENSESFIIRYYFSDNSNDIIFGSQDFTLSSRYIMSDKSGTVYEVSNIFDKYLTTSIQSWTEPYIISQQVLGNISIEDVQRVFVTIDNTTSQIDFNDKLLDLRHGGLPNNAETLKENDFDNPLLSLNIELGNKNSIKVSIIKSDNPNEQEYNVLVSYFNFNNKQNYNSYSKISGWTYNKIREITL